MRLARPSSVRARRRVLATGAVVAAGLLVTGCSADEPAEPEPTTTTTVEDEPTETPEPTPTETGPAKPKRPAAMEQEDAEGAAAAAEYYLELYPYVMATGDTSEWDAMSHETCESCKGLLEDARTRADDGDVFEGGMTVATVIETYKRDEPTGIFPLDVEVVQEPVQILSTGGDVLYSEDRSIFERRVEMGLQDGAWIVVAVAEVPA